MAAEAPRRLGVLFHARVRLAVVADLRKRGSSFTDAARLAAGLSNDLIDGAAAATPEVVAAVGDGSILSKILAFLDSPLGQTLVALLVELLLGG